MVGVGAAATKVNSECGRCGNAGRGCERQWQVSSSEEKWQHGQKKLQAPKLRLLGLAQ